METSTVSKKSLRSLAAAGGISVAGLAFASIGAMYIAGMFSLSVAFASQIIAAVAVGGWILAVVMGMISGGLAGVVVATARWAILHFGKEVAIA